MSRYQVRDTWEHLQEHYYYTRLVDAKRAISYLNWLYPGRFELRALSTGEAQNAKR
jgi:hypothetical protein